ncbi:MAG: hypothetical protein GXP08_17525 [Gammaproteobacteria bacterium]|nr:hypothetical protein [Gammaproteobacteria bacterium]
MKQLLISNRSNDKRVFLYLLPIVLLVSSCTNLHTATVPAPAYRIILPGATLTLKRELTIPAGTAGLIIQGNRLGNYAEINAWYPNCRIELRTMKETPQTISPDTFTVHRVTRETDYVFSNSIMLSRVFRQPATATTVAAILPATGQPHQQALETLSLEMETMLITKTASLKHTSGNGSGPMAEIFRTYLYVTSITQPNVFRFMCEHWEDPISGEHLTVEQIKQALGNIITLNVPIHFD